MPGEAKQPTIGVQNVVQQGFDYIYARHPSGVDLTGLYVAQTVDAGYGPVVLAAWDIVPTPIDFIYAFDAQGRPLDPRRFAGDGGTPLGP